MLLRMQNITKEFSGITVLKNVNFDLNEGEVHALVGENGAGKSTLIKILGGAIPATSGEIFLHDKKIQINSPTDSQALGISIIYQELMLAPALTASENILLGRFPRKWKIFVDKKKINHRTKELMALLGSNINLNIPLHLLTVAQQQMVEVAKALSLNARIIVMDEPSAVLTPHELEILFAIIEKLKKEGVSFIYISHRLEEIFRIADRITVLRDGELQETRNIGDVNREQIIKLMVGRDLINIEEKREAERNESVVLEVKKIQSNFLPFPIDFKLYKGEILGIAGLVGAKRTELVRAIFGADKKISGEIFIDGKVVDIKYPNDAVKNGIGFVPEDRKNHGILKDMSVSQNITITNLKDVTSNWFINNKREYIASEAILNELNVKTKSLDECIVNLSGGNQQKVILGRWIDSNAKIIILDEPTRGIDVAAKSQIYQLMRKLIEQGASIIMISSELPEVLKMSDRIIVMREGKITGEIVGKDATEEEIINLATL